MTMRSMTGFSRLSNGTDHGHWLWEMRSVNGKGLDLRLRLPKGFEELDPIIRDLSRKYLYRGNCNFALTFERQGGDKVVLLNETALKSAASAFGQAATLLKVEPAPLEAIMAVKGVLELVEDEDNKAQLAQTKTRIMQDFETSLKELVAARSAEGQRLATLFEGYLSAIKVLVVAAEKSPSRSVEAIADRLGQNLKLLFDRSENLDETRLHQEAIFMATKADIEEEIQRLHCHIEAAYQLLAEEGAVGRKFDFLIQEFNREANTLCSKANADDITKIGLQLKVIIDQMREQVQNIE